MYLFHVQILAPVLGPTVTGHDGATGGWGIGGLWIVGTIGRVRVVVVVLRGGHYHTISGAMRC